MKKSKSVPLIIIGISAIIIVAGLITYLAIHKGDEKIIRTGQIEMRELDIASKISGRLEWVKAEEGSKVDSGTALFKLTGREIIAKVGQAKGSVNQAQAQVSLAREGARPEQIQMAEKNYSAAVSQFDLADVTYKRMKKLHNEQLISDQELDVIFQKYQAAIAQKDAAKSNLDMALNGTRRQEREMAVGQYEKALSALEEANVFLDETTVFCPINGIVAKRYADPGELVASGYPVLSIIDPQDVWVELNIPETELKYFKLNSELSGFVRAYESNLKFRVINIAAMADFANWRAQNEKGTFDVRSFTIKLKPESSKLNFRPGMTVSFEINK